MAPACEIGRERMPFRSVVAALRLLDEQLRSANALIKHPDNTRAISRLVGRVSQVTVGSPRQSVPCLLGSFDGHALEATEGDRGRYATNKHGVDHFSLTEVGIHTLRLLRTA